MEKENYSKNFKHLKLQETGMEGSKFENCNFDNCNFLGTYLDETSFDGCVFTNCRISLVKITNSTKMQNVRFEKCEILGVLFSKSKKVISPIHFDECHLKNCDFSDMKLNSSKFIKCLIEGSDFINSELKLASFKKSRLPDTTIQGCTLIDSNFLHASDFLINPAENKLFNAKFSASGLIGLVKTFGIKVE